MPISQEEREDLEFLSKQANLYHAGAAWGVSDFGMVLEEIVRRYMMQHGEQYDDNPKSGMTVNQLKVYYSDLELYYVGFYKEMCKTARKYLEKLN